MDQIFPTNRFAANDLFRSIDPTEGQTTVKSSKTKTVVDSDGNGPQPKKSTFSSSDQTTTQIRTTSNYCLVGYFLPTSLPIDVQRELANGNPDTLMAINRDRLRIDPNRSEATHNIIPTTVPDMIQDSLTASGLSQVYRFGQPEREIKITRTEKTDRKVESDNGITKKIQRVKNCRIRTTHK